MSCTAGSGFYPGIYPRYLQSTAVTFYVWRTFSINEQEPERPSACCIALVAMAADCYHAQERRLLNCVVLGGVAAVISSRRAAVHMFGMAQSYWWHGRSFPARLS